MAKECLKKVVAEITPIGQKTAIKWISQSKKRRNILLVLIQPMTAKQISARARIDCDYCSKSLSDLTHCGLVFCCNPHATRSRLYWFTDLGAACQDKLCSDYGIPTCPHTIPRINWNLYGWVCYSHRSIVIKMLTNPMQSAEIKRKARANIAGLKMSANNARDVIKQFLPKGIVQIVKVRKKVHPRFELTALGLVFQKLLLNIERPLSKPVQDLINGSPLQGNVKGQ